MKLTKPIEEYTLRELLLAIKDGGLLYKKAINHITEAKGEPFENHASPIDLSNRKLGDVSMDEVIKNIPINLLGTIRFVGKSMTDVLTKFAQDHDINWTVCVIVIKK